MDMTDIIDIKGPIDFPSKILPFLIAILILGILYGLYFLFKKLKKRKTLEKSIPPKLPHEIAYERLEELKNKDLVSKGRIGEFYTELSDIARHYLEDRFVLRAPEMTTEEFLIKLKNEQELNREQKSLLREFLSHCDMVKFAKYGPTIAEVTASFDSAKRLVDETKEEAATNVGAGSKPALTNERAG